MEREQIVRDDFPTARKGWSPEAVRAHLLAVAAAYPEPQDAPAPAAAATSEQVRTVIAAAETAAAEIVAEARSEADRTLGAARAEAEQIRAAARTESEQTVTAANREATGRVEQARGAVEGLIAQADKLRAQVGSLGRDLASSVPGSGVTPAVAGTGDPADPAEAPSDEDLISQLRAAPGPTAEAETEAAPPVEAEKAAAPPVATNSGKDPGAARLVAMNMALDGAPREQIAARIESEFGSVEGLDRLLDDVLRRAGR
jgi:cell division septum initiation protein DivIVA